MTTLDAVTLDALADALAERIAQRTQASPFVDAKAAAAQLGVPSTWLLTEARANRIPHVRLGRYVRFNREELAAWADAQVRGPRVVPVGSGLSRARGQEVRGESC
jgi:excisionase family DNA binding protein